MSTTMLACGGHQRLEFCEFPKVLGDCCEGKFILDAVWAAQSEPGQAKDADLSPKFPPSLHGVLGVKSVTLGGHFVHVLSLHELHRRQVV